MPQMRAQRDTGTVLYYCNSAGKVKEIKYCRNDHARGGSLTLSS